MSRPPKKDRNKELTKLRESNPDYYSWRKLGEIFNISHVRVKQIYEETKGGVKTAR